MNQLLRRFSGLERERPRFQLIVTICHRRLRGSNHTIYGRKINRRIAGDRVRQSHHEKQLLRPGIPFLKRVGRGDGKGGRSYTRFERFDEGSVHVTKPWKKVREANADRQTVKRAIKYLAANPGDFAGCDGK